MHGQGDDSDDETNFRALSDKWQFRRKQKRWLRRKESTMATPQDALFSSNEDLLDDHTPENATPTDHPLMLVSELRKSPTGLDCAVKTYSFMVTEDQLPSIQVEDHSPGNQKRSTLQKSSDYFSSFDSEDDYAAWDTNPYPSGGMENFASGMMNTFESNLLKLTQSLPDIFEATKHYNDGGSSDTSPLSSASVSTVSILDAVDLLDTTHESSSETAHGACSNAMSPLVHNGYMSPKDGELFDDPASDSMDKVQPRRRPDRVSSTGSGQTWGSNSPLGSESSERESLSAPSPQPLALERLKGPVTNGLTGSNGISNGFDSTHSTTHHTEASMEERTKRNSRTSVTSSKYDEPVR